MVLKRLMLHHGCLIARLPALLRDARDPVAVHLDAAGDTLLVLPFHLNFVVCVLVLGVLLRLLFGGFESRPDALCIALLRRFCVFFFL